ncbi:MAG: YicC/YloC family endoribonuclease [bacterium]|nr:YicC/YloC family endoribonuclease [bacterium]
MIKSMTGYGKGTASSELGEVSIEIKTVNHRFRDISIRFPNGLNTFESAIKKEIEGTISRGKIDTFIAFEAAINEKSFEVNLPVARGYHLALTKLQKELNLKGDLTVAHMVSVKDIIKAKEIELDEVLLKELILKALKEALLSLNDMRKTEGSSLSTDIKKRLSIIYDGSKRVESKQPELADHYMAKLKKRLKEMTEETTIDDARLIQEVAIMAEKSDVTEETVRLESHIKQFEGLLDTEEPVGRKLDFLIQEMNREVNTIGSKSGDSELSRCVVDMKAEIERIREQVQNIE